MNQAPITLLPITTITSSDVFSAPQQVKIYSGYAVQAYWTGAALMGTVQIEGSLDYNPGGNVVGSNGQPSNAGTWSLIQGTNQSISGAGNYLINAWPVMYSFFRLHFIYTSGSGTISALAVIKGGV